VRVLVIGSGGVGAALAAVAKRRRFFERITFADVDRDRARSVVEREGDERFDAVRLDASRRSAIAELIALERANVVLNAVDPRFNPPIFDAAFDAAPFLELLADYGEPHAVEEREPWP
jgi:saccharopine dehydrogenase-like NADP-dependent oxidoreductase